MIIYTLSPSEKVIKTEKSYKVRHSLPSPLVKILPNSRAERHWLGILHMHSKTRKKLTLTYALYSALYSEKEHKELTEDLQLCLHRVMVCLHLKLGN